MFSADPDHQDQLPPRYAYVAAAALLGTVLVALIVALVTLGEETTISKIFLTGGFVVIAVGLALVILGLGNHGRATARLKSEALDLVASRSVVAERSAPAGKVDDPTETIKAIEAELLRVGATNEANEVATARREGLTAA